MVHCSPGSYNDVPLPLKHCFRCLHTWETAAPPNHQVLSPAEADYAEDQDQPDLPTVSSKDVMKLSLVEDNTVILQVEDDRSSLPPPRKKRISQADVLEEQHKALKLQQEMLQLKKKKLRMEILLIGKELDNADKENLPN
ncbi:uncharacterized protein [Acropora muricata]|uniref:uncharacterized protein n=1 Tax=Acropora muricata TaxID=159855 RepID=UPI0034E59ECF